MAPKFRLHYFDFTGRGEPIRILLTYGGLEFDDIRIEKKDWPKVKPSLPLGQLPVLEIDGKMYPQTTAILKYLAQLVRLDGDNPLDNLKINVAVDTLVDLQNKIYEFTFEEDAAKKKAFGEKLYNEILPYYLSRLEENAKSNGGHLGINRLNWADIYMATEYEGYMNFFDRDVLMDYPNLQRVIRSVLTEPRVQQWIRKRPRIASFTYDLRNHL